MVSRGVLWLVLALGAAGCVLPDFREVGRKCSSEHPCGPGLLCDPVRQECTAARAADASLEPIACPDSGCPPGLGCVQGACVCGPSSCGGCCSSPGTCLALEEMSTTACGTGGQPCKSCDDRNSCTSDRCSSLGLCVQAAIPDGSDCTPEPGKTGTCQSGVCTP